MVSLVPRWQRLISSIPMTLLVVAGDGHGWTSVAATESGDPTRLYGAHGDIDPTFAGTHPGPDGAK
jgi:hypothetical protein